MDDGVGLAVTGRRDRLIARVRATFLLKSIFWLCFLVLFLPVSALAGVALRQADGSALELEAPVTKIITLSPHLAELVFAAGAGKQLIATVEYSEFPAEVVEIPRVGDAFRIDVERISALRPDLVIAWESGNPSQAIEQLNSLGLPVWIVEIREPAEIAGIIEEIGAAAGAEAEARVAATKYRQRLEDLERDFASRPTLDYFYQIAARPLFTINGQHLITKGLSLCGGRNIFHDEPGLAFQVSHESVIVADPDALFAPDTGGEPGPLDAWLEWPGMQAVRANAMYLLPADKISRATPRLLDALEVACKLLDELRLGSSNE